MKVRLNKQTDKENDLSEALDMNMIRSTFEYQKKNDFEGIVICMLYVKFI